MPRPKKQRCIKLKPCIKALVPLDSSFEEQSSEIDNCVCLEIDEVEAIRLADYEDMYHEEAAKLMGVSRVTFGRILKKGRKKLAKALIEGLPVKIEKL